MPRKYSNPRGDILQAMQDHRRRTGQNASVRELARITNQSKSNVQHHLTTLWSAGKIRRRPGGRRIWES